MRNAFYLLLLLTLFSSCRTKYFMYYHSSLQGVKINDTGDIRSIAGDSYSDSLLTIKWSGIEGWKTRKSLTFHVTNRSGQDISIDWNNVLYINQNNQVDKVTRVGTGRRDNMYHQIATTIPSGLSYSDVLRPTYNYTPSYNPSFSDLFFSGYSYYSSGFTPEHSMEHARRNYTKKKKERDQWKDMFLGRKEGIYMPIIIEGVAIPYIFLFEIDQVTVIQHNPDTEYWATKDVDFPGK